MKIVKGTHWLHSGKNEEIVALPIQDWYWTRLSANVGSNHYNVCKYCNGRQIHLK